MTSPTTVDDRTDKEAVDDQPAKDYSKANPSKFRFKSKRSRKERDGDDDLDHHRSRRRRHSTDRSESSRHDDDSTRRRHHRRHHHRHHRSRRHETPPPAFAEPMEEEPVSPNTAFRLSLFDAMADDEGALFWEGVYGQPIHTYPRPDGGSGSPSAAEGSGGFLESMTDEEYAEYVRTKMWEKTHQHVMEERERRERERERRKEEEKRRREDGGRQERQGEEFRRRIEESLRRGEARREGKKWKAVWDAYLKRWDDIIAAAGNNQSGVEQDEGSRGPKDLLPWPVESGKLRHVEREEVERFWLNVPVPEGELMDTLKRERVRWHPDKIQQRFSGGSANHVDEPTMKAVTAIFQVLDRLWSEMRDKAKG